jgi:hypothetical protein
MHPNRFASSNSPLPRSHEILTPVHTERGSITGIFIITIFMAIFAISTLLLLPAVAVGRIATRGGSRRDGDIAMAIFASYVIGQFMPLFY